MIFDRRCAAMAREFLYRRNVHYEGAQHWTKGVIITIFNERKKFSIVSLQKLAKRICMTWVRCRFKHNIAMAQKMAPLAMSIYMPCAPWTHINLELSRPYWVKSMMKKQ